MSEPVLSQPECERQTSKAASAAPASGFRALLDVLLLSAFVWAGMMVLLNIVVHSERWDLPKGPLLRTLLSSCQFEHVRSGAGEAEHMLCPTRLGTHDFPQAVKDAVLASEDERFHFHGAIDPHSTARAVWHSALGVREGGSTITQQLARSLLLKKEDSLRRKVLEAVLAERIFALLPRDEILTRYLNVVPHARNMNGFDDPARYYFGVGVEDLNLAEAALLVGMLPEPNNRDPVKAPAAAFSGGVEVLNNMHHQGMITERQAANAEAELKRRVLGRELRRGDEVYQRIEYRPYRDLAMREAAANGIKPGGDYRLIVFVDAEFQRSLLLQVCDMSGAHQAAGVFMRPSGEVLALAGACRYTGGWNRATDIARSIGSTGKLFPLIGVHEAGVSMETRISTAPLRRSGWPAEPNSRCLQRRSVSLDFALEQSCNRPWTEAAMRLGPRLTEIMKRFGITSPAPALVPIGGVQTSPLKLAQAYAALGNNGRLPNARFLVAAIGPRGNMLGAPASKPERRVMSQSTAASVLQDLRAPVRKGTGRAANSVHALVYGKTGTSSHNEDALFVGITQDFIGSLWLGYDRPTPMPGTHGGGAPAKAFAKLTDSYYVRVAQERFAQGQAEARSTGVSERIGNFGPREKAFTTLVILASVFAACFLRSAVARRRRETPPLSAGILAAATERRAPEAPSTPWQT